MAQKLTYRELQILCKENKNKYHNSPKCNSKRTILEDWLLDVGILSKYTGKKRKTTEKRVNICIFIKEKNIYNWSLVVCHGTKHTRVVLEEVVDNKHIPLINIEKKILVDVDDKVYPDIVSDGNKDIWTEDNCFTSVFSLFCPLIMYTARFFHNVHKVLVKRGSLYLPWSG